MRFTIITTKPGQQPPQTHCDFFPPGGTIGRGVDNNLVLPDDDRTLSRLQAIVHITANGECRLTNRGNVTRVLLNDIPLERGRQVELQDGDILGIDDYQLLVSDLNSDHQPQMERAVPRPEPVQPAAPVREPAAEKASTTAAIPSEIWDSLAKEFSISDDLSKRKAVPEIPDAHPLTTPAAAERNPEDPLAQLINDAPLDYGQQPKSSSLFDDGDALFAQQSIFDLMTAMRSSHSRAFLTIGRRARCRLSSITRQSRLKRPPLNWIRLVCLTARARLMCATMTIH